MGISLEHRPVNVSQEWLTDIQLDGTELWFLRHYVHSGKDGRVLRTFDTDLTGFLYERTGIRVGRGSYFVFSGVMCMYDPEFPDEVTHVKQFLAQNGTVTYTTMQGQPIMEWPTGVEWRECEAD